MIDVHTIGPAARSPSSTRLAPSRLRSAGAVPGPGFMVAAATRHQTDANAAGPADSGNFLGGGTPDQGGTPRHRRAGAVLGMSEASGRGRSP
jgi:hypothetical protein